MAKALVPRTTGRGLREIELDGTVARENITGAATVDVAGHAAATLTMTGDVFTLDFTGWDTDTTVYQRVRVQIRQDATGGRTFDPTGVAGVWLEPVPTTLGTDPDGAIFHFYADTTDGGATVWLEPIGIQYSSDCVWMQGSEAAVPAVTAGGNVSIAHGFSMVTSVDLIEVATGRRVLADWRQAPSTPGGTVFIDFDDAHTAGTYTVRVAGVSTTPCELTVSVISQGTVSYPLAMTNAASANPTVFYTGTGTVQWDWGDGSPLEAITSGVATPHAYAPNFTGNATLIVPTPGVTITSFSDLTTPWTFDLADLPPTLMTFDVRAGATTGNISALPATLTSYTNFGSNTTSGDIANLPTGLTVYDNRGSNTTSGDLATLPTGLTTYNNQGSNTTTGDVGNLPAGLTRYENTGNNTTSGNIDSLPATLTSYANRGLNTTAGDVGNLPVVMTTYTNHGNNTTSGSVDNLPAVMTTYDNRGSNTTAGLIDNLPTVLATYTNQGANTVAGDLANMPTTVTRFTNAGNNTVTGDIASTTSAMVIFDNRGLNTASLVGTYTPGTSLIIFTHLPAAGSGLPATDVDAILAAIDALDVNGLTITLTGDNAAPTAAGATSAAGCVTDGWAVSTN